MPSLALSARLLALYPALATLDLAALLANTAVMQLPVGTLVFDEHQPCLGFPLILSGSIRVSKVAASGRELQLYRVLAGESCILTSSCLLGHTPYQARGSVAENLEMVLLPASIFHQLLAQQPAFRSYVFSLFADRLTDLMTLVSAVAFQKLDQRLAALLISKASPLHSTHQALADELGSAREMVSRLLKNFAEQGWVKLGREHIDLIDLAALQRYATL
ncbi:MAG: Crp/Fnr family transcriptional regulator [Sideroxydans sp.]|nr:Crp/Fnr family transcriptional regulator [Sideroxydans sp.]